MKKSTKIILSLVAALSAAICLVCCFFIFQYFRGSKVLEEIRELDGVLFAEEL